MLIAVFAIALLVWVGCTTSQATDAAKVSVEEITTRWEGSGHADITSEAFTHWNEDDPAEIPATCAKCHSTSGFRDFVERPVPADLDFPNLESTKINPR